MSWTIQHCIFDWKFWNEEINFWPYRSQGSICQVCSPLDNRDLCILCVYWKSPWYNVMIDPENVERKCRDREQHCHHCRDIILLNSLYLQTDPPCAPQVFSQTYIGTNPTWATPVPSPMVSEDAAAVSAALSHSCCIVRWCRVWWRWGGSAYRKGVSVVDLRPTSLVGDAVCSKCRARFLDAGVLYRGFYIKGFHIGDAHVKKLMPVSKRSIGCHVQNQFWCSHQKFWHRPTARHQRENPYWVTRGCFLGWRQKFHPWVQC